MRRSFNTAGPCDPTRDYMLPAMARLPEVRGLIEHHKYFVVHAPRQVGKTTALFTLARELTHEGAHVALLVSMERGVPFGDDIGAAELAILDGIRAAARRRLPPELAPPPFPDAPPGGRLGAALEAWARAAPRPLVLFLDEIDALKDNVLLSVLRQIREGYPDRPATFPASMALIGMRDVRDYKISAGEREHAGTASPFNIKARSLTLRDFTRDEVGELYGKHTAETGQVFHPDAVSHAFRLTMGQPWLVNALGAVLVDEVVRDRALPILPADIERARQILIERQDTHLDSLTERLREPRVRAILAPMLAGSTLGDLPADDIRFAIDLGLVRMTEQGGLDVANPIYREIIVRELILPSRAALPAIQPTWLTAGGRLDEKALLDAFLAFWRQHGEPLLGTASYHEIAPHLVLMAFLHRVVNGGGTIEREYAIGKGRMDLCVRYGQDTLAIEIKVWRDKEADPKGEGLAQLDRYLEGLGLETGWLVIFDRRSDKGEVAARTLAEAARTPGGRAATVIRG